MEDAAEQGQGAVSLDGRMIDAASIRQAEVLLEKMAQVERMTSKREAAA
jgi:malyl-CoA/(S)-citramalyl-CoA lyase